MIEKYSNLTIFPNTYMELDECPNCGAANQEYIETYKKPCNCIFKKVSTINVFYCDNCKIKYGVKE